MVAILPSQLRHVRLLDLPVQLHPGLDGDDHRVHLQHRGHHHEPHLRGCRCQCPGRPVRHGRGQGGVRGHGRQQRHREQCV